jgi:hypothetical protein
MKTGGSEDKVVFFTAGYRVVACRCSSSHVDRSLHVNTSIASPTQDAAAANASRLEPMLIRLPPAFATELRNLARRTRVRQSDYLREAVADLLAKYGQLPTDGRSTM